MVDAGRRAVLAMLALSGALVATACAPVLRPGNGASRTARPESGHATATAAPPMPTPTPTPTPSASAVDPAEVAARFQGTPPTAFGLDLPGVRTGLLAPVDAAGMPRVALTFDACGGSGGSACDTDLLSVLRAAGVPATLFLNARWIAANPALAAELAADPLFLLANHGTQHRPLSVAGTAAYGIAGTGSAAEAVDEVWGNHLALTALTGAPPRHFRAGTAHYDDVGVQIALALGEEPIGFTVNGDGGASYGASTVHAEMCRVGAGGIVLAHMNQPQGGTAEGTAMAITALRERGVQFVHVDG